ncbi:MAG: O-antigen ligase family protein [Candidatus Portnoybacteria bacterium]|nr:O-antigen ligase family protein [Candidatus Portnoybacteria bacterium]
MLQKINQFGIYLITFSLPFYLVRFKIGWVPTNLLELLIIGLFVIWLVQKYKLLTSDVDNFSFYPIFPIFLIFFGVTISTLFSSNLEISAGIWKSWFVIPLLFLFILINELKTKEQIRNVLITLFLSGIGVSLIALSYWFDNNLTYDGRLRAFYLSPNYLAMYLSPILILSFYLYFLVQKKALKFLLILGYLLLSFVIYLTYSYGAWLGLLGALFFLIFKQRRFRIISVFLLLFVLFFIIQIPGQKFQSLLDFSYPSLESRIMIWQSAWEIIKDHPLNGIGPGMFQKYYLYYQARSYLEWAVPQPHNLFLAFWLQTGLIGLIGFIWLLKDFFKKIRFKQVFSSILIGVMIYILIHGLIDTPYWKNDLAVLFWLIIALSYKSDYLFD